MIVLMEKLRIGRENSLNFGGEVELVIIYIYIFFVISGRSTRDGCFLLGNSGGFCGCYASSVDSSWVCSFYGGVISACRFRTYGCGSY